MADNQPEQEDELQGSQYLNMNQTEPHKQVTSPSSHAEPRRQSSSSPSTSAAGSGGGYELPTRAAVASTSSVESSERGQKQQQLPSQPSPPSSPLSQPASSPSSVAVPIGADSATAAGGGGGGGNTFSISSSLPPPPLQRLKQKKKQLQQQLGLSSSSPLSAPLTPSTPIERTTTNPIIGIGFADSPIKLGGARQKFGAESHNYEPDESEVWRIHEGKRRAGELFGAHTGRQRAFVRWTLTAVIAILTELVCVFIISCTAQVQGVKFASVLSILSHGRWYLTFGAFILFMFFCLLFAAIACMMCLIEPASAGSGIPEVKAYLNGIDLPRIMRVKTLLAKTVGIIFAQASGLPLGIIFAQASGLPLRKEGPMIHIGAIIGSGFSQGKSKVLGIDTSLTKFEDFRNHKEKRDFVACGTAAGVAAAFGAPIGGMLFAMEEGASYWTLKMTWRCFFCAIITSLLGFMMVASLPKEYVAQFYYCDPFPAAQSLYAYKDLPIFCFMGMVGGIIGATFNQLNRILTILRLQYITSPKFKFYEVLLITSFMACLSFFVPFAGGCKSFPPFNPITEVDTFDYTKTLRAFRCTDGSSYNELASLYFTSWDDALRLPFHLPMYTSTSDHVFSTNALLAFFIPYFVSAFMTSYTSTGDHVFSTNALIGFFIPYFVLAFMTFGSTVPSGLFIPSLLSGAALGRIVGQSLYPIGGFAEPGVYSLIGASAVLGGMSRMTISLSLILLEATGNLYLLIPLFLTLLLSRWMGNFFNEGIYDMHLHFKKIPFLEPQCWKEARVNDIRVCEIMSPSPKTLSPISQVGRIYDLLASTRHNCFPLLDDLELQQQQAACKNQADKGVGSDSTSISSLQVNIGQQQQREGEEGKAAAVYGIVLRDTLCALLYLKAFSSLPTSQIDFTSHKPQSPVLPYRDIESFFPNFPDIFTIAIGREERDLWIDLRAYCNMAPYIINQAASVPRAYRLFRTLGMRHLLVINTKGHLVGIVTRHDLLEEHLEGVLHHTPSLLSPSVWTVSRANQSQDLPAFP